MEINISVKKANVSGIYLHFSLISAIFAHGILIYKEKHAQLFFL